MDNAPAADLLEKLRGWGLASDNAVPLAEAALVLAALDQPGIHLDRYRHHLRHLTNLVRTRHAELLAETPPDSAHLRRDALASVIAADEGYEGDSQTYDDLRNASLIQTISRRRGLPITLAILYLHVAHELGWDAYGLNFPGHFLARLDLDGERLIFDPFREARPLGAAELRRILKETQGPAAELSASFYAPADNRMILIRLQNNIKSRQIAAEDYQAAFETVARMRLLDPGEHRLLLEAGVLGLRAGHLAAAAAALEDYLARTPDAASRHDAALLLQQIRAQLAAAPR